MDTSGSSEGGGRRTSVGGVGAGALTSFIKLGFLGVSIFAMVHLVGCYILGWLIGVDFSTVVYVTAASVVTGTLIVFTVAFLVTLNIVLTAVTGLSQGAMNMFGGAMGGASRGSSQSFNSSSTNGNQRSHISDLGEVDMDLHGQGEMKLD